MLFIWYPGCSACKKAKAWLDSKGLDYETKNIRTETPGRDEIKSYYKKSGLPLKKFFNTSGLSYKAMGLKDKLPVLSEDEQLKLLASDGMLIKRPLLITENKVLIGFREKDWEEALL